MSELVEVTRKAVKERLQDDALIMWEIARLPVNVEASLMWVSFNWIYSLNSSTSIDSNSMSSMSARCLSPWTCLTVP
jgi:hypothetical protein